MHSIAGSAQMSLCQFYIPQEIAHATTEELGQLGLVQMVDLNPDVNPFQRTFVSELRRCVLSLVYECNRRRDD